MFSNRTQWSLATNRLTSLLEELKKTGKQIIDLTESNPTRCGFSYPQEQILREFTNPKNLEYAPDPKGMLIARQAVSRFYREKNIHVEPDQIILTASTSEGYSYLFRLLANPGEQVLFPHPSYPLFNFLGELNDVHLGEYPLAYRDGWKIDVEALKKRVVKETKAVVIVNPNNPTGSYAGREELAAINQICRENSLAVISDEVFWDYPFQSLGEPSFANLAENKEVLSFCLGGLSKALGLPQMKLSWIIVNGPAALVAQATARLEIISDTFLSVNTPIQNALPKLFECYQNIRGQILGRILNNRKCVSELIKPGKCCEFLFAQGGWYAIIKVAQNMNEEELILRLLREDGVLAHPGYFFDFPDEPYLVLSLLPQEEQFREGFKRILQKLS